MRKNCDACGIEIESTERNNTPLPGETYLCGDPTCLLKKKSR